MRPVYIVARDWAIRCFGKAHVDNKTICALRLVEEAIEYAQAIGVPEISVALVTKAVYERPKGEPYQELGGVLMTATVAATTQYWDPDDVFETELRRVLAKPTEHFAARNREKLMGDQ